MLNLLNPSKTLSKSELIAQGFHSGATSTDWTLWWNDDDDCIVSWGVTHHDAPHDTPQDEKKSKVCRIS